MFLIFSLLIQLLGHRKKYVNINTIHKLTSDISLCSKSIFLRLFFFLQAMHLRDVEITVNYSNEITEEEKKGIIFFVCFY